VDVSGSYQCTQAKVQGKILSCSAAPLILRMMAGSSCALGGQLPGDGEWVTLSDSLTKARAKIVPDTNCAAVLRKKRLVRNDL